MRQSKTAFWAPGQLAPSAPAPWWMDRWRLDRIFRASFRRYCQAPYKSLDEIQDGQLRVLKSMIEDAYEYVPFYKKKYLSAGLDPRDIRSWDDFSLVPTVTKGELLAASPHDCIDRRHQVRHGLYRTRSTGTSGRPVTIYINRDAILHDTIQGVRQFWLQSAGEYLPRHDVITIYTTPWWFSSVGPGYRSIFVSSLLDSELLREIIRNIKPFAVSTYPSHLATLMQDWPDFESLRLIVVHSEQSTPSFRRNISSETGVYVLDEYSSEEATRIALELPCGHYHICEDASYVELLPAAGPHNQSDGCQEVIISNMLNKAMPFIRYRQGDFARLPKAKPSCDVNWRQIDSIDGRRNDNFITSKGEIIASGVLLDITYHWLRYAPEVARFELIQVTPSRLKLSVEKNPMTSAASLRASVSERLESLLSVAFRHSVTVDLCIVDHLTEGKRNPIRRTQIRH